MKVQRYTWEDTLIEAESLGILPSGAVNLCLRLARAINWEPINGGPSELRWKNVDALESVNSSRATYFRYRSALFEAGFLTEVRGNLRPQIPELSHIEPVQSQVETTESHIETAESQIEHPYSEDSYSEDLCSEDSFSERQAVVADAPTASDIKEREIETMSMPTNLNSENPATSSNEDVTDLAQSQIETAWPWMHNGTRYWSQREYDEAVQREKDLAEWDAWPTPERKLQGVERI